MRKWLAGVLVLALLSAPCFGAEAAVVKAPSAVLMTTAGQVLLEKDPHSVREPASVTKVMTLLLACEAIDSGRLALGDKVTASAHAASMGGSQIWLEEGEVLTVEEMLKCIAVVSANDCAVALGEHLAGSEEAFVAQMNARAAELGMTHTCFRNACGLPEEGHVTCAYDIGLMSAQLLREHGWICDYATIWQDTVRDGASVLNNTNKLLKSYPGITGLKTGYTAAAGYCVSATAEREGLPLIAVIMGGESSAARNEDAAALLDRGFAEYAAVTFTPDRPLLPVPVTLGTAESVPVEMGKVAPPVLKKADLSGLEKTVELPEGLSAPVEQGQQLGRILVKNGTDTVAEIPLLAARTVERLDLWSIFCRVFAYLCGC